MRHLRSLRLGIAVLLCAATVSASEPENRECLVKPGERVIFFGDSITQAGHYAAFVEAFLRTRMPDANIEVVNHGISSETLSGTSEPDHDPRRPCAHDRFDRDIAAWEPDVVVACFGMNDGNYHPFSEERFAAYQAGVRRLIERLQATTDARLVLLTPPPYDPYRRKSGDENAESFGYKFAYIGYDDVLRRYADWLLTLRDEGIAVIDVHRALSDHLALRRQERVGFHLSPDSVHPNLTGHWLMAQAVLEGLRVPAAAGELAIEASGEATAIAGDVSDLVVCEGKVDLVWRAPLPMAVPEEVDAESVRVAQFHSRLNRYTLVVRGLSEGQYRLSWQLADVAADSDYFASDASYSADELAAGIDLNSVAEFPTAREAAEVVRLVRQRQNLLYKAWRADIASDPSSSTGGDTAAAAEVAAALDRAIQPRSLRIRISPAE